MPEVTLFHQDNREVLRDLIMMGIEVDSVVTDPPYFLESVVKRFGKVGSAPAKEGTDGRFSRQSKGFMGKTWDGAEEDGTRIAFDPEFWSLVLQVLKPGGYVFAFSSARTGHWQAVAMEQAGFIPHPFITWNFGSGFPKATSVVKKGTGLEGIDKWEGWFYGTQSFKPAMEPIYMMQKPMAEKTGFANVLKYGTGAVNIDACRVPGTESTIRPMGGKETERTAYGKFAHDSAQPMMGGSDNGRWPANLVHDGSEEVLACFPDSKGQQGDVRGTEPSNVVDSVYSDRERVPFAKRDDSGSAARFFNSFPPDEKSILYHPKANKHDRGGSKHPTVKPVALMQHLIRAITPPGGVVLDPFAGSGTTGQAALNEGFDCLLIEREDEYAADIRARFGLQEEAA